MLLNLGLMELVIRFVKGVSQTPRARSSNPGVDVVALCCWEEKRCPSVLLMSSFPQTLYFSSNLPHSSSLVEWELLEMVVGRASNAR